MSDTAPVAQKKGGFDRFEELLNKYLGPIAEKVDKQRHLGAVKKAMVAMTPLLLIGSFCLIPAAIPNMIGEANPISVWILANTQYFDLAYNVSMGLMSVFVAAVIAYHLARSYELDVPGSLSMALVAFLLLSLEMDEAGGISLGQLGSKGLFVSMFGAIVAVEVYRWCKKRNFTIKMPETVPDFISSSFEVIPVTAIVIAVFLAIRIFCNGVLGIMPSQIFTMVLAPLVGSMDSPIAVTFYHMLRCFIFFFGIHPSVLSPIVMPIATQFLAENIAAVQAGGVATHIFTPGPMSGFGGFTGLGVTMGVVIWFLFSKSKAQREIGKIAFIPSLFGVNEPILFGAPIVLNPIMFIPFVLFGGIISSIPFWFMSWGWLDCSTFTPPYVGVFLEGYLTNFDWRSIVANVVQLALAIVAYGPFCKVYERRALAEEARVAAELAAGSAASSEVSAEDEALIEDLDLDF